MTSTDVVVGAGSGMGAEVARRLAAGGRRLLLADVDLQAAEQVAASLPGDVEARRCDITDGEEVDALAAAAGDVGALVLTAGLSPTMAAGSRMLEVDLVGPARLVRAFEPRVGAGSAAVLFASMAGHLVAPSAADAVLDDPLRPTLADDLAAAGVDVDDPGTAYAYAKRGLIRLARREAAAWGRRGARLLTLSPGIVDTPMGRQEGDAQPAMAAMVEASPLGREIDAGEVAAVACFLVSASASAMTGTDVLVDGGAVAALMG